MPSGCLHENEVQALLEGALTSARVDGVESHLDGCLKCQLLVSAAVRTALDICEADPVISGRLGTGREPLLEALDQEQQLIRSKYGQLFQEALRNAVGHLSKRDRSLLRFHYVAGMSLDAIARTYRVHRATVARWLATIRDDLDSAVRIRLWDELGVSTTEFQSLWNAVRSDVDVSISALLAAR